MKTASWDLAPEELEELFQQLRFKYHKWDVHACGQCLLLPESIVLSPAEHARVVTVSERFAAILAQLEARLVREPDVLLDLGIPKAVIPLIQVEPEQVTQLARYDLFPGPDGRWMISEFNEDVPGGFNEAVGIPELLGSRLPDGEFVNGFREALVHAFSGCQRVALVHATGYSEDLQHMLVIRDWLASAGTPSLLASPSHLSAGWRGIRVLSEPVDGIVRFYPGEWYQWLSNHRDWKRALPRLRMMNPLRRLIRQSKRLFVRWATDSWLSKEDQAFVLEHTPASVDFDPAKLDLWLQEQTEWVLKAAFGRMGDSVVLGSLTQPKAWKHSLEEASRQPSQYLMQRRFDVAPLPFIQGPLYPALGAFLVNGRFAGYYSRAASTPFLTHEAYHVATLVQPL